MSANKHTPAPWQVADKFNCVDVRGVDGPYIANCNQSAAIDWRTKEANARLIAAAPELLEALVLSETTMTAALHACGYEQGSSTDGWTPAVQTQVAALVSVRAAIAKATGVEA